MHISCSRENGRIIFAFSPDETEDAFFAVSTAIEEQISQGKLAPDDNSFRAFRCLCEEKEPVVIWFPPPHHQIAYRILEVLICKYEKEGVDSTHLHEGLAKVELIMKAPTLQ